MSWSRTTTGTPNEVIAAIGQWEDAQRVLDANLRPDAADGHATQIVSVIFVIDALCQELNDREHPVEVTANAWGHHDGTPGSNSAGVTVSYVTRPIISTV